MVTSLSRAFAWLLVAVHVALGVWAFVGFVELVLPEVPWSRLSNPAFTRSMLLLQWTLIALAASTFVSGYLLRIRYTPIAMLGVYGAMAATCAYQTFFILTNASRFRAMVIEYVEYAVILLFLFYSKHMRQRFSSR